MSKARLRGLQQKNPRSRHEAPDYRYDYCIAAALLASAGLLVLWFFYSRNEILLSGDAVAHINIARRVFDSRTPGPMQLGTVWLPLPHVLTIPFVVSARLWKSGLGGSIPSMVSYVIAGLGIFRLLSIWSRLAAWLAMLIFAANPNVLYVQTTALNEPMYLACFIWSLVFFVEANRALLRCDARAGKWLERGAIALAAGILTRYDGWFLAFACWLTVLPIAFRRVRLLPDEQRQTIRRSAFRALLLTTLAPTLWLAFNFGSKGNPLDFANGPYSAKAIAERTTAKGAPPYPGEGHPWTAGIYFEKAAQLNMGESELARYLVMFVALAGLFFALRFDWQMPALLWSPLAFYALSIAYGSVPIFLPVWWPFSYYNLRYGLELIPAIAVAFGFAIVLLKQRWKWRYAPLLGACCLGLLVAFSYLEAWRATPVCLREVRANGQARLQVDRELAKVLDALPADATILSYVGSHSGAFEMAGVPFRRTINEGIYLVWDSSLQCPAEAADYVIASADDPVAIAVAVHPDSLTRIAEIDVPGQPRTTVYRSTRH
ncbi:MAG TPA: hypothetical protein VFU50_17040 [Terriglobales bacterium]|nr:hypothetical protein [Terriglobales bacterium]